jgi:hypothetical protein
MSKPFWQKGDKLICIMANDGIKNGQVYTFKQWVMGDLVRLEEVSGYDYYIHRFQLLKSVIDIDGVVEKLVAIIVGGKS